jgi:hypothetical protein
VIIFRHLRLLCVGAAIAQDLPPFTTRNRISAVWRYSHWSGERKPEVILDLKPVLISTVCKNVLPFDDPLPEDVFEKLFSELHMEHTVLEGELDADPTYGTAACCFPPQLLPILSTPLAV